jgi:DNA-binding transcriptional LysR family regulator
MELRRIRSFVAVAEELNFRRAAERLNVGQSPLSKQIRKLEEEVGTVLLERDRHHVALTPAGAEFLDAVRGLLVQAEESRARAREVAQGRGGRLRLGYLTSLIDTRLSTIISSFRQALPGAGLALSDLVPNEILAGLREGRLEVGFFRGKFRDAQLASRELWRDRLVVALPRGHWLAGRGPVDMRALAEETFVMVPDLGSMGLNEQINMLALKAGFAPRQRIEVNQLQATLWLVDLGMGVAIVPEALGQLQRGKVVCQPLVGAPTLPATMVWRKDNPSQVLARFLTHVRSCLARL